MMKKFYLLFCFLLVQLVAFAQSRTINFTAATGSYPGSSPTQNIAQGNDNWNFTTSGTNATEYRINYGDDYLEVTTQGSPAPNVAKLSIKRVDGNRFNFKSLYIYVVGSRQKVKFIGLRGGVAVSGLTQTYDLSTGGVPDATFTPSGWTNIDEVQIVNNGGSNENGTGYINDLALDIDNFTYESAPVLVTGGATAVGPLKATFNGNLVDQGFAAVTEKGFVYSTSANPTTSDTKRVVAGASTGTYNYNETTLASSTTYHVRAYATNSVSTAYGADQSFTTSAPAAPTATTGSNTPSYTTASLAGTVNDNGANTTVTFDYGTTNALGSSVNASPNTMTAGTGSTSVTGSLTGLTPNTTYYYRVTAVNSVNTTNGSQGSFTTLALPTVSTDAAASITSSSATLGGNITAQGGSAVTERGVVYSTSTTPTTANTKALTGSGTGTFSGTVSGLAGATTYYVRAYAINSGGTSYGGQQSFTTTAAATAPTATTGSNTPSYTTASLAGTVNDNGASTTVTFDYGTTTSYGSSVNASPNTIAANIGSTAVTGSLTGLAPNTTYYYRVTAVNSVNTTNGSQGSFTTLALPTVSTDAAASITSSSATLGGNVSAAGGSSVTDRGVVYATTTGPTTANTKALTGTGTGTFSGTVSGLSASTLYYVRAYATNGGGTVYGNEQSFTTPAAVSAPSAANGAVTSITTTSATLNGTANDNGASTTVTFDYGTSASLTGSSSVNGSPNTLAAGGGAKAITAALASLTPGTTYYYRIKAVNSAGTTTGSSILSFTTSNSSPAFTNTSPGSIALCQNSSAVSLTSLLTGSDADNGQTLTWSVTTNATHGTLGGFPYSASSTGGTVVPTGLTYTPTNGYNGSDTFTISLSDGIASASFTVNVTINALPTAAISYAGTPYCATGNASVSRTGTTGGTYTSTTGLSIDAATGSVNLVASTAGTYTVTYTYSNGTCSNTATTSITINTLPTATISYAGTPYCATGTASVTQTGTAGGTYTSTTGLSIDASTGVINLAASTAGTYTVTYTFSNGTCSNTTTTSITINALPTATIAYSGSPYVATGTASVTQTGTTGGTYTSTTGLSINASTGAVNLAASTPGSYTVTYTFSDGTCSNTTTTGIVISTPAITAPGSFSAITTTTYGTASDASSISVSGSGLAAGITATPSPSSAFEVSSDGTTYGSSVTIGTSGSVSGTVYVRLKANAPAGTYTTGSVALTSTGANNPTVTIPSSTVSKATLTYVADATSKVYGASVPTLTGTVTGFKNSETIATATTGTLGFSTTATSGSPVGSYTITGSGLSATNYTFAQATANATALSVTAKALSITADDKSKVYGAALPTLTASYTGFVNGDNAASLTTPPSLTTTASTASPVGNYAITASGAVDANYTISYVAGNLTVTPATLAITADDKSKVYGAALPTLTASYTGFVNGDNAASLTTPPSLTTTASTASPVGNYAITASGAVDANYTISYVAGNLSVTPATLAITADDKSKVYGAALPTLTASYAGFLNGDTPASLTTPPSLTTSASTSSPVGNYAITASGAVDANYTISYVAGNLSVTPATLAITADDKSKVYGAALPTLTASYAGFVNGDNAASLTTPPSLTTTASTASPVGNYAITASGAVDANYTISYVAGNLSVTPATLAIAADDKSKVYGAALPTLTASYTGFVNGDTPASLTTPPSLTTTASIASPVGNYAITPSGAVDANYTISYVAGNLAVTPATLAITADDKSKVYGAALPTLTASYTGFVNGDNAASLTTPPSLTTTASTASPVGNYAITASGAVDANYTISYVAGNLTVTPATLAITADDKSKVYGAALPTLTASYSGFVNGDDASNLTTQPTLTTTASTNSPVGNYAITASGAVDANYTISYVAGNLSVTPATLAITAVDKSKVYGAALPALTASYAGFVNGDDASNLTTQPTLTTTATTASPVGNYAITASGAVDANYTISYVAGNLAVTPATLSITAVDKTKVYGAALPTLTASYTGFVNGDTPASLTTPPSLTTTASTASPVGNYAITASGAVDANYTISYTAGNLSVTPATLAITADDKSKVYGAALPTLTASYSGFVNGDNASSLTTPPTLTTTASTASPVGNYAITASGAVDANYTISYTAGNLSVTPATLAITADDKSKVYGAALPTLTASYSGFVNGDNASSLTTPPTLTTTASTASPVGNYAITASGAVDANYTISYTAGNLSVTPATLAITADDKSKVYGAALPTLTASYSGFVNGDTPASLTTPPGLTTTASTNSPVGNYAITASGAVDANYTISYVAGNLAVTPATLAITADDKSKVYGAALPTLTASYTGFINGDNAASLTTPPSLTTTASTNSPVGNYAITASGAVDANYTISYVAGNLAVTPATLSITAVDKTKVYGAALPTLTASYTGFVNGDTPASLTTPPSLTTTASTSSPVGNYAITASGAVDANYTISYVAGNLSVTPATLAITANDKSKVYGAALPALTASYSGFVNGDTPASLTTAPSLTTTASTNSPVGNYAITASGAVDANYTISYVAGNLSVTPATLAITADDKSKVYGATLPTLTASYAGFVNGDNAASLTTPPSLTTTASTASPVGNYAITASGAVDANYTISYVAGNLSVTPATLAITADDKSKVYGAALPTLTASYAGFVNGDNAASLTTPPSLTTTASTASPVGNYAITASGAVDANYTISYVAGNLSVTPATLAIAADDKSKVYGAALPTLTASYTGFVNGDTPASLTTPPSLTTTASIASPVGNYAITPSGAVDANYTISYVAGNLAVTPATLAITADDKSKVYGAALPTLTASYTGFVNGDNAASLTTPPSLTTTASTASPVGNYAITASGAVDANYTISYVAGNLTVTPATLAITADDKSKVYGAALPTLTASYSGFVNGDDASNLTTQPTLTTTASTNSPVGNYAITASGAVDANYTISYVAGNLSVTPATLAITAVDKSKVYGAALPALTASYAGFVNGDDASNLTTQPTLTTTATTASPVGNYAITASGAVDANYTISYVAGNLAVTPATLSITAVDKTKVYGAALPTLTASYTGFVNGDTPASLTTPPSLTTTASTASPVGNYAITASGAVDANYTISYTAGNLSVTPATLAITADDKSKVYGAALPTLTASYSGFVNGDNASSLTTPPTLTTTASTASPVGNYAITASGAVDANYTISYTAGNLSVTPATLAITADDKSKVYGAALPTLTASYSGFVNGDTPASLTTPPGLTTTASTNSPVGNYAITASGAVDANYTISYVAGNLAVTPATLAITADDKSKVYGAALPTLTASYTGFINGDNAASLTTPPSLTTTASTNSPVGNYAITASGAVDANYTISYVAGNLAVTPATLSITAVDKTKVYGAALPTLTASYTGFVNGDTPASLTTPPSLTTTASTSSPVGNYAITASGAVDANYTISYVAGNLSVTPATLAITANDKSKVYGAALPALTASYSGFVNGDTPASLTTAPSLTTTASTNSPVGNYAITASGAVDANYTISYVAGNLSVTPATLAITADDKSKVYGATLPTLTASYAGFVNGDDASNLTTQPTLTTTASTASPVGNYAITASGAVDANYTISYVAGNLSVTPATLSITAVDKTKVYGAALPTLTASYTGFVNGDDASNLTTQPTLTTTATTASPVGNYAITASGAVDANYTISYVAGNLAVTPATLSITAVDKTKVYGAALPTLTASYTGFVNGDTPASLTTPPSLTTTASTSSPVGNYAITASGAVDANYTISYVAGNLSVTPATLAITADDKSKVYGAALPALTASYSGFVNGDTPASLTTAPSLTTTASTNSPVGNYAITASGAVDANYTISYVAGNLAVTPAKLAITADDKSKVYGAALPILTVSYAGFVNGDNAANLTTQPSLATTATTNSPVGNYAITASGAVDANYTISYTAGNLSVTPAAIAVTATAKTKTYGDADPALTYTYTGTLIGSDAFTGALSRAPGENVGVYAINKSTLALSSNYTLTYIGANLVINKAPLTITADNKSRLFLQANPTLTASYSGFKFSDSPASLTTQPALSTTATRLSLPGVYPILAQGAAASNYTITYQAGQLRVLFATRNIAFNALPQKTYGDADFDAGATLNSGETPILSSSNTNVATIVNGRIHIVGAGTAVITATAPDNGGYDAIDAVSQILIVDKAQQTIGFASIPNLNSGDTYDLSAVKSSSGLPVTLTVADHDIASVTGTKLSTLAIGTTSVTASAAGNANYYAAPDVKQPLKVVDKLGAELIVRKAVSPNGDGINDALYIEGIKDHPINNVIIINRNGVKIFEIKNYNNADRAFDGHSSITHDLQQAGTYFYLIELNDGGSIHRQTGYFLLKYQN